jgi:hypothetical protein
MANIPSNYTFEEVLHFYPGEMSETLLLLAWSEVDIRINLEKEVEIQRRHIERLEEQIYFRDEYIREVLKACDETTKIKDLKNFIKVTLENSYIEL